MSGFNYAASISAAYASSDALPHPHARLASGRWLAFSGWESNPLDSIDKFPSVTSNFLPSQVYPGASIDLLRILQRHSRRLPPARLRNCGKVNVQRGQILSRTDPSRMATHPVNIPLRHANPLRNPLEDRRNAPRIERSANLGCSNQSPEYRPLRD